MVNVQPIEPSMHFRYKM